MSFVQFILNEPYYFRIKNVLTGILKELDAELVLLIHRSGQQIAFDGSDRDLDITALSSLAAASLAATDGLARLIGEEEFAMLFQHGRHRSIHISSLEDHFCLVLLFGPTVPSGLVRWKVRRASGQLSGVLRELARNQAMSAPVDVEVAGDRLPDFFSDEEIEKLFGK